MKLLFEQRFFSWFDSYDIYDEDRNVVFVVEGKLSLGHRFHILDAYRNHIGTVQEEILTFLPRFEMFMNDRLIGTLQRELSLLHPRYDLNYLGWSIEGNFMQWDYTIRDRMGNLVATISKQLFNLTDTYVIDVVNPVNAIYALMVVVAIDAEKCSRK